MTADASKTPQPADDPTLRDVVTSLADIFRQAAQDVCTIADMREDSDRLLNTTGRERTSAVMARLAACHDDAAMWLRVLIDIGVRERVNAHEIARVASAAHRTIGLWVNDPSPVTCQGDYQYVEAQRFASQVEKMEAEARSRGVEDAPA